jgi:hypothetical protein
MKLPTGSYLITELLLTDEDGKGWAGSLPAAFSVIPDGATYLGTWQIRLVSSGTVSELKGKVLNEFSAAVEELRRNYTGLPQKLLVGLLSSEERGSLSLIDNED